MSRKSHFDERDLAPSPSHVSRVPIFAPTRKPRHVESWAVATSWGEATITGRLGQPHRDVLDASRMVAEREVEDAEGRRHLLVDSARLRAALGWNAINYSQISERLEDLRLASVRLTIPSKGIRVNGGVVSEYIDSFLAHKPQRSSRVIHLLRRPTTSQDPPQQQVTGGGMWRISFSLPWSVLLNSDLETTYPLGLILGLRHGVSQALARFCWTHRSVNEPLAGLLGRLGSRGRLRDRLAELIEDAPGLAKLSVSIWGARCIYPATKTPSQRIESEVSPVARDQNPVNRGSNPVDSPSIQLVSRPVGGPLVVAAQPP
ncbi:conserved hypothetical protein [Thiomonas sp. CB3]|nr:conserved hypothetical protein [Thiomonas sp. CB3]